jgi:hypothetical protein
MVSMVNHLETAPHMESSQMITSVNDTRVNESKLDSKRGKKAGSEKLNDSK